MTKKNVILVQLDFGCWQAHCLTVIKIRVQEFHTEEEYKQRCKLATSPAITASLHYFLSQTFPCCRGPRSAYEYLVF